MALAYRRDDKSGLVLAEEHRDEARLSHALKQIDDRLVLQREKADVEGGWKYRVLRVWSEEHPPTPVLTWTDEYGRPLPLTDGLLDKVKIHMLGFRGNDYYVDADEHNRRHQERIDRQLAADLEAVADEHRGRLSGRLSVSMSGRRRRKRTDRSPDMPLAHERPFR